MPSPSPSPGRDVVVSTAVAGSLARHATELYDDSRLTPMLRQLIRTSCRLSDAVGGSISLVNDLAGRYTKVAEFGTACRLGQSFPLSEGITGAVLDRRAPVVLGSYREIATGHLKVGHPAWSGAVAAIPIWWRADIVAVNVIFAGVARVFSVGEIDDLELVTQVVAPGLITAIEREMPDEAVARRRPPRASAPSSADGPALLPGAGAAVTSVNDIVAGLLELTHRATDGHGASVAPASGMELKIIGDNTSPRLLFRPDASVEPGSTTSRSGWQELIDDPLGVLAIPGPSSPHRPAAYPSPLSSREREVAALLGQGLSDRAIAADLFVSPKTIEKHVSAVLRKTATSSRTAAVVLCMQKGWM